MILSLSQIIGNTPLLKIRTEPTWGQVYIKLEAFNPGGSIKDRVALAMIEAATDQGLLEPGRKIIEATSGNTGIGLAMVAAARGLPLYLAMPASMSEERQKLLRAYGARLILTSGELGMAGAIEKVKEMLAADSAFLHLDQFSNPANAQVHFVTTGPEIYRGVSGQIDAFVAGVGTGGTLTGAGKYLRSQLPGLKIYAVEPADSPVLSGGKAGAHTIQGIGAGFIPQILDTHLIDGIIPVTGDAAFETVRDLTRSQGILAGISSGAAVWAALKIAKELGPDKTVVTIAPDSGERYLSTPLFSQH